MLPAPPIASDDPFAHALETCRRFLLSVANREFPDHLTPKGGASDLVQNTLVTAYLARDRFRGRTPDDLRAWLRGILANELAVFRRRYRADRRDVAREVPISAVAPAADAEALDGLVRAERTRAVAAAVACLPGDAREVLVLRLELRLGFREIGDRTGRSEDAARKLYARAIDRLREATPNHAA